MTNNIKESILSNFNTLPTNEQVEILDHLKRLENTKRTDICNKELICNILNSFGNEILVSVNKIINPKVCDKKSDSRVDCFICGCWKCISTYLGKHNQGQKLFDAIIDYLLLADDDKIVLVFGERICQKVDVHFPYSKFDDSCLATSIETYDNEIRRKHTNIVYCHTLNTNSTNNWDKSNFNINGISTHIPLIRAYTKKEFIEKYPDIDVLDNIQENYFINENLKILLGNHENIKKFILVNNRVLMMYDMIKQMEQRHVSNN